MRDFHTSPTTRVMSLPFHFRHPRVPPPLPCGPSPRLVVAVGVAWRVQVRDQCLHSAVFFRACCSRSLKLLQLLLRRVPPLWHSFRRLHLCRRSAATSPAFSSRRGTPRPGNWELGKLILNTRIGESENWDDKIHWKNRWENRVSVSSAIFWVLRDILFEWKRSKYSY